MENYEQTNIYMLHIPLRIFFFFFCVPCHHVEFAILLLYRDNFPIRLEM